MGTRTYRTVRVYRLSKMKDKRSLQKGGTSDGTTDECQSHLPRPRTGIPPHRPWQPESRHPNQSYVLHPITRPPPRPLITGRRRRSHIRSPSLLVWGGQCNEDRHNGSGGSGVLCRILVMEMKRARTKRIDSGRSIQEMVTTRMISSDSTLGFLHRNSWRVSGPL